MVAGKVRIASVARNVMVAAAVLGVTTAGCQWRWPEDPERAVAKWRAEVLRGSRILALGPLGSGGPICPAPLLQIDKAGIMVSLYPSGVIMGRVEPPSPPLPSAPPSIWGQVVVPRAGVCPSVPRRNGQLDGELLALLLGALNASLPRCPPDPVPVAGETEHQRIMRVLTSAGRSFPSVVIAPGDGITWQEIVEVIDTAADANLKYFIFLDEQRPASCAGAMTPEVLRERLAGWKPEVEE